MKNGSFRGGLCFEENELMAEEHCPEEFFIRLGYALAGAAGGELLLMHEKESRTAEVCRALARGACLAGASPAMAGEGFYAYCAGLTAIGGFSAGVLCTKSLAGGERLCFFDRSGLPANGRLIRRIRDAFSGAVICGRVGRAKDCQRTSLALYRRVLCTLSNVDGISTVEVGIEEGSPAADCLSSLLRAKGHTVVPYGRASLNIYVYPDGRR